VRQLPGTLGVPLGLGILGKTREKSGSILRTAKPGKYVRGALEKKPRNMPGPGKPGKS